MKQYSDYENLRFERPSDGVLLITIDRQPQLNAADSQLHDDLGRLWNTVADDDATRCAVITGAGRAFSAGGDLDMVEGQVNNYAAVARVRREAGAIVYNMLNCPKPIISAINGVAVGAGLAVAIMADISVASRSARLTDGHARLGVGAGDHAAIIWPLLCGMAKAKYYLLTSEFIDGAEAERIGLVSMAVEQDEVVRTALDLAAKLAAGPQDAIAWTKYSLNNWLRVAGPIFDTSLNLEMLNFFSPDVAEGLAALREKRAPRFPSAQPLD